MILRIFYCVDFEYACFASAGACGASFLARQGNYLTFSSFVEKLFPVVFSIIKESLK